MNIHVIQAIRKVVLFFAIIGGIFLFAVTESVYPAGRRAHELIEWTGLVLIVACILGRTWCSLYISGRKNEELVTVGPYSVMRNPLYFFSVLGAAGMGAQIGSIVLGLLSGFLTWLVFAFVVRQEERHLFGTYGERYSAYRAQVPRFFPKPSLWRDEPTLTIHPSRVLMTFVDALLFLLAVPGAEMFEYLRQAGLIPVLLRLPSTMIHFS